MGPHVSHTLHMLFYEKNEIEMVRWEWGVAPLCKVERLCLLALAARLPAPALQDPACLGVFEGTGCF